MKAPEGGDPFHWEGRVVDQGGKPAVRVHPRRPRPTATPAPEEDTKAVITRRFYFKQGEELDKYEPRPAGICAALVNAWMGDLATGRQPSTDTFADFGELIAQQARYRDEARHAFWQREAETDGLFTLGDLGEPFLISKLGETVKALKPGIYYLNILRTATGTGSVGIRFHKKGEATTVKIKGGGIGHAIGLRLDDGHFSLFDPNEGHFDLTSTQAQFADWAQAFIDESYPKYKGQYAELAAATPKPLDPVCAEEPSDEQLLKFTLARTGGQQDVKTGFVIPKKEPKPVAPEPEPDPSGEELVSAGGQAEVDPEALAEAHCEPRTDLLVGCLLLGPALESGTVALDKLTEQHARAARGLIEPGHLKWTQDTKYAVLKLTLDDLDPFSYGKAKDEGKAKARALRDAKRLIKFELASLGDGKKKGAPVYQIARDPPHAGWRNALSKPPRGYTFRVPLEALQGACK
jgi:hypothetical protein